MFYVDTPSFDIAYNIALIFKIITEDSKPAIPKDLLKVLYENMRSIINIYDQNDINEFYSLLIDKVCSQLGRKVADSIILPDIQYKDTPYDNQRRKMDLHWCLSNKNDFSVIKDKMHGQLISQIICSNCGKIHHNYELFCSIMLSLPQEQCTLEDCLREHFKEEMIDSWTCDGCNQTSTTDNRSQKAVKNWRNPEVLVITLKRFNSNLEKTNISIEIPHILDVSEFTLGNSHRKYNLKSVAYHGGSIDSGHYITLGKTNNEWYLFDDETVSKVDNYEDGIKKGYMYFYEAA
jgi:ubiquitin C-terminal hydrolase